MPSSANHANAAAATVMAVTAASAVTVPSAVLVKVRTKGQEPRVSALRRLEWLKNQLLLCLTLSKSRQ